MDPGSLEYPAGKYTDIKFFNKVLMHLIELGERVEAEEGPPWPCVQHVR